MDGTGTIKPIQTRDLGIYYRSRTEARWAVFMSAIGVEFNYEPEGYRLHSGLYLPDFWLPDLDCFIEIKPFAPSDREESLASNLCAATRKDVFMFTGEITYPVCGREPRSATRYYPIPCGDDYEVGTDDGYLWCQCHFCNKYGICYGGRSNRLPCKSTGCPRAGSDPDRGLNYLTPSLLKAYELAVSARFEHGEGR